MNCPKCQKAINSKSRFCNFCGAAAQPEVDDPSFSKVHAGDIFEGKWRIESKLGQGGMGAVFLAHDISLERQVAIKILAGELCHDGEFVDRFEREAKLTAKLEHPNIVPIYAVGRFGARPFIVMKVLEGVPLGKKIRESKTGMSVADILSILKQLCSGLGFIHTKGFVHRDIKSANIHLSDAGHATILDFGIIRDTKESEGLTRAGMLMGTPHYMAPEQAMGNPIDSRTDLYALGCMVFEMFTARLPFIEDSDYAIIAAHVQKPPPNLCDDRKDVPSVVGKIVQKMLAKKPGDRYQTAQELYDALEKGLRVQQQAPSRTHQEAPRRSTRGQTPTSRPGNRPVVSPDGEGVELRRATPARGTDGSERRTPASRRTHVAVIDPAEAEATPIPSRPNAKVATKPTGGGGMGKAIAIQLTLIGLAALGGGVYLAAHNKPELLPPALVQILAPDNAKQVMAVATEPRAQAAQQQPPPAPAPAPEPPPPPVPESLPTSPAAAPVATATAPTSAPDPTVAPAPVPATAITASAPLPTTPAPAVAPPAVEQARAPAPRAPPRRQVDTDEEDEEKAKAKKPAAAARPSPPRNACPAGKPASLRVLTPGGWASISVDGTPWGDSPITREIDSGTHRVRARRNGEEVEQTVCVRPDAEPTVVTLTLR
ncbi:MAG: protein kinase [Myxococcales bacterium]|nr:protein kinase [Myxococcales bacterium]